MNSTRILTSLGILLVPILSFSQKVFELDISGQWKFTIGDREEYATIDYDDENWEYLEVPSPWEAEGFSNYNGYAWYRFTFDGSDLQHTKNLLLNLGYIDDVHEAYLNNELLGFKGSFPPRYYTAYDALNEYHIPSNLINENGKNVIAVRVYDLTLDGGIVKGNDIGIWYQTQTEDFQNLAGVWEFTKKEPYNWSEPSPDDAEWDNILVPSYWKSKHIKWGSRSYGYYRKEFYLDEETKNKDLYLILGKIDDFDVTYVNGVLIGTTKDGRRFGSSNSYSKQRIYKIPEDVLNQNGKNVIAIEVEDIGGDAGIYEGPIGLVPDTD